MKSFLISLIFLFGSISFAQTADQDSVSIEKNKRIERTKTIMMSPFSGIKVFSGIQVKLIPSTENKLILSGENFETVVTTLKKMCCVLNIL